MTCMLVSHINFMPDREVYSDLIKKFPDSSGGLLLKQYV